MIFLCRKDDVTGGEMLKARIVKWNKSESVFPAEIIAKLLLKVGNLFVAN